MKKTFNIIEVAGFSTKNATALWDGRTIDTHTSFDLADFDFGEKAQEELEACKDYIRSQEKEQGWIEGYVNPYISVQEIEEYIIEVEKGLDWEAGYLNWDNKVVANIKDACIFNNKEEADDSATLFNIEFGSNGRIYARVS